MSERDMSETQIDERLERLSELAQSRREAKAHGLLGIPGCERYIRISSSGYRPVSVGTINPCGALLFDGREVGTVQDIGLAYEHATEKSRVTTQPPGKQKPEHQLQAFLIRRVLNDPVQAPKLLACDDLFDELRLVTDEFAIDNFVRADLLMLGRKKGQDVHVPVFLELKAKREGARLIEQLTSISDRSLGSNYNFEENVSIARKRAFERFLRSASGIDAPIDLNTPELIAVWPVRASSPAQFPEHRSVKEMRDGKIHMVGFCEKKEAYKFSRE